MPARSLQIEKQQLLQVSLGEAAPVELLLLFKKKQLKPLSSVGWELLHILSLSHIFCSYGICRRCTELLLCKHLAANPIEAEHSGESVAEARSRYHCSRHVTQCLWHSGRDLRKNHPAKLGVGILRIQWYNKLPLVGGVASASPPSQDYCNTKEKK